MVDGMPIKLPVIMTSDETSEDWWAEVALHGWKRVQFPSTLDVPIHGEPEPQEGWSRKIYDAIWDRMLIEAAVQSLGAGFVGTGGSTMSRLAQRRVEHWRNGVTRIVHYGDP